MLWVQIVALVLNVTFLVLLYLLDFYNTILFYHSVTNRIHINMAVLTVIMYTLKYSKSF